jgi:hypothetical protein
MKFVAYIEVGDTGTEKFYFEAATPEKAWEEIAKEHNLKDVGLMTDGVTSFQLNSSKGTKLRQDVNWFA